jgi:hypothetical protein
VNDKNSTKIVNTGVMKTRPSQQNKTNILPLNQFFTNVLNKNAFRMLFSLVSQVLLLLCRITWSDPIHKKSARNLNLYDFCHSPKKLAAQRYHPLIPE